MLLGCIGLVSLWFMRYCTTKRGRYLFIAKTYNSIGMNITAVDFYTLSKKAGIAGGGGGGGGGETRLGLGSGIPYCRVNIPE